MSQNWEYDVFPSFHGPDVRKTFLSHVLKEFRSKRINLFIDNEIKRGKSIGPELIQAIRGSKIVIVLLSKNYASSSWCLDELVEIMKKELGQTVITIFYEVYPTVVKKQTRDFGKAFKKTCKGKTKEKIEMWRKALEDVSTIAGYHSSSWDDEATMIENIANDISKILNHLTPSRDFDHLIGMEAHMERIKLLLRLDLDEVKMIGIWGPSGIGKTTIARFLFNQVSRCFQNSAIMVNIKGSYPSPCLDEYNAQLQLQSQMLSQMINQKEIVISHLGVAQGRLRDKKVFLVLDDVDRPAQLDALAKNVQWFGPSSRIIITTEDLKLLIAHGIEHIYKVNFPSTDEARQIFCTYAFGQKTPKDGFAKLALEITYLVGELPLGLQVMGCYFRGLPKQQWSMEIERLRTNLNGDIESILKFSYDALCDEDKDLFLHIACFFNHQDMEKVEEYLAGSFKNVRQRLQVLFEKSLISSNGDFIVMHNLLALLGKEIIRKQCVHEPGQRRFLVDDRGMCDFHQPGQRRFLVDDRGMCDFHQPGQRRFLVDDTAITRSVIGIHYKTELDITEKAFERMSNLQFLRIGSYFRHQNIISSGPLNYISPKLRLLQWSHASVTSLPFIVNLEFLVELSMEGSKLEKLWDGIKLLRNLKWMHLAWSKNLKELPNLSRASSLKELDLSFCSSMVELPSSIGNATNLNKLDLDGCSSLVELPSSIGNATNLKKLNLGGCTSLVELPFSIGNLHKLENLNLKGCSKLKTIPININMESLDSLDLTDCWSLKRFPEISTNIKVLKLIGTSIKEVPLSIRSWSRLSDMHMSYSENLKEFTYIHNIITELHLRNTEIQELGPWVRGFSRLKRLVLKGMQNLVSLSQLPDSLLSLGAQNCVSLEKLDCSFFHPRICLNFGNCLKLNEEARDLIIQTSTYNFAVLPGGEVPACFTYRASGSSVTAKLNQKPFRTSTKFKACILFFNSEGETEADDPEGFLSCYITSKQNSLTGHLSNDRILRPILKEHLYIFDFKAEEVTSIELVFEFKIIIGSGRKTWEIKECGILPTL